MLKRLTGEWSSLKYWQCGEWQVVEERLNESSSYNPERRDIFASLVQCPYEGVRICVVGQDPYPKRMHCTGVAFSIPAGLGLKDYPPTLVNIFKEYEDDLHYPTPKNGDLTPWVKQGVLLWNVYPTCQTDKAGSHHWDEWTYLTKEILEKLNAQNRTVFVFLGSIASSFSHYCNSSPCIITSHPSPLGARFGFRGSRIFSRTNAELCKLGQATINWELPHEDAKR